jgi:hypothetical protein
VSGTSNPDAGHVSTAELVQPQFVCGIRQADEQQLREQRRGAQQVVSPAKP